MKTRYKRPGLIHALAFCQDCDWSEEWFPIAVKKAQIHAKQTGHTVDVETGYTQTYNPKELK